GIYDAYERAMSTRSAQRITEYYPPLEKWFDITATPSPQGLTVYFRDITEFRNLSEQLAQSQRLEAIGRLTGGIAHDFNNLLTVVMGGVESLEQDALDHQEEVLDMMKQAAGRGAELTHRLLAFARRQPLEPESVDVSRLI